MPSHALKVGLGFVAGATAVLIFHQGMYLLLNLAGLVSNPPWRFNPVPPLGVPTLFNQMFWGGLWGVGFALLHGRISGPGWLRGVLFGMIGPMLFGSWLVVAMIKGQPIMAGWVPQRLLVGFLLNGIAFGLGLGLTYPALKRLSAGRS